ncbi:MAG TPA: type II toxin-antitoxin system VapC family toxin [Bryobacteraceae bacterium]|nr:type II toxin-antitoxin system VapC family toxin [Bryobacteraceae bacterium]
MKLVLDASAAIEVLLGRGQAARLAAILGEADVVLAPDLFVSEVVNTVWKYHHFERLNLDACDRAIESALALVDNLVPSKDVYGEAFLLARTAHRPAYDMFYLALARREDAVFLTLDKTLRKEAEHQGVRVA